MVEGALQPRRRITPWIVWNRLPPAFRGPAHSVIRFARRRSAMTTRLPDGTIPLLPAEVTELPTRYGGFWFDGADRKLTPWIRSNATWEEDVLRYLRTAVRPGMTVVDVGANVGFLSVLLSRLVGQEGHVHAFEPLADNLLLLRGNLWRHDCVNTTVHPFAVSDAPGSVEMELDSEGASGAHLGSGIPVEAVTLDDALRGVKVDVLKVDVEGAEPMVLRGARELLARSPGLVAVVEFRGSEHLDGSTPEQVLDLYDALGLDSYLLRADGRAEPASRDAVLDAAQRAETINIVLRNRG